MLNDARTRLRKMAKGWKVIRKAYRKGNNYDATIQNVGPDVYRTKVTDKNKVVVSQGEYADLELARKAIRGNFIALGCNIPQARSSEAVAVTAPTATTLTITSDVATATTEETITVTVLLVDELGLPMSGVEVSMASTGDAVVADDPIVTDENGQASTTITNATAETVEIEASVGALTDVVELEFTTP